MIVSASGVTKPIKTLKGISKAENHNERNYEDKTRYDKNKIIQLEATPFKEHVNSFLKQNIENHNKDTRKSRQFKDGFDFIEKQSIKNETREIEFDQKHQDLKENKAEYNKLYEKEVTSKSPAISTEIIFMLGDKNNNPFKGLNDLDIEKYYQDLLTQFKGKYGANMSIYNATIHLDEATPHMHILAIPHKENNRKIGISIGQRNFISGVGESKEFQNWTHETMQELADKHNLNSIIAMKKPSKRPNLSKSEYITLDNLNKYQMAKNKELGELKNQIYESRKELKETLKSVSLSTSDLNNVKAEIEELKERKEKIKADNDNMLNNIKIMYDLTDKKENEIKKLEDEEVNLISKNNDLERNLQVLNGQKESLEKKIKSLYEIQKEIEQKALKAEEIAKMSRNQGFDLEL